MRISSGRSGIARIATFVAALVLVLQSALAFAAPPIQRDIFGNVICTPGSTEMPGGGGDRAGHMPDCCLLLCGAAFQTFGDLPPDAHWPAIAHDSAAIHFPVAAVLTPHDRRTPANSRAPPPAA